MKTQSKIYVAGHTGLVGSAIVRKLKKEGYQELILRTHAELDLTDQQAVEAFFQKERPEYVFDAAALVGGIQANSEAPADFFYVNMQIENNLLWTAHRYRVKKLLFLGSACMYPKECRQPMTEDELLTGLPEYTNEGYALAKTAGCRLCSYLRRQYGDDFICAIPANTYGPGDSFDPEHSHVIPALIMKYERAKQDGISEVALWGTGKAKREFIHVDDIADACLFLMKTYSDEGPINVGTGEEVTIMELSQLIKKIVGFDGQIVCDPAKPDGMMRRVVDSSRLGALGWRSSVRLETGLRRVYEEYLRLR